MTFPFLTHPGGTPHCGSRESSRGRCTRPAPRPHPASPTPGRPHPRWMPTPTPTTGCCTASAPRKSDPSRHMVRRGASPCDYRLFFPSPVGARSRQHADNQVILRYLHSKIHLAMAPAAPLGHSTACHAGGLQNRCAIPQGWGECPAPALAAASPVEIRRPPPSPLPLPPPSPESAQSSQRAHLDGLADSRHRTSARTSRNFRLPWATRIRPVRRCDGETLLQLIGFRHQPSGRRRQRVHRERIRFAQAGFIPQESITFTGPSNPSPGFWGSRWESSSEHSSSPLCSGDGSSACPTVGAMPPSREGLANSPARSSSGKAPAARHRRLTTGPSLLLADRRIWRGRIEQSGRTVRTALTSRHGPTLSGHLLQSHSADAEPALFSRGSYSAVDSNQLRLYTHALTASTSMCIQ